MGSAAITGLAIRILEFISSIFIRAKKDGSYRMILNLKDLNTNVEYHHFGMGTLQSAVARMRPGFYMPSIDLRDAYYSIPIEIHYKKYLKFYWKEVLYQFIFLPNGLATGPHVFTKIVKPIYSNLRQLASLMQVTLTAEKTANIKHACIHAIKYPKLSIRELAQLIGILLSSFPGVQYGQLHFRSLEMLKTEALTINKGNFEAMLTVSSAGMDDLQWWVDNIEHAFKPVGIPKGDITMNTAASKMGWGAVINGTTTGGRWTGLEFQEHINILELKAMFMRLISFHSIIQYMHIQVYMDNSTVVAYINSMGGAKSIHANKLAKEIRH